MTIFIGTWKEFIYHFTPRIKQQITILTKPYRDKMNNVCPKCNRQVRQIDSAHVHGRDRPQVIGLVIKKYKRKDGLYEIKDLDLCIKEITNEHIPIEKNFLFLCKDCHKEYDSKY